MDLEHRVGPWSLRGWGLVANLLGNALLLHGAVRYSAFGTGMNELISGAVVTVACIIILAIPSR